MTDQALAPLRLYYVRHGETAWTLTGQHTGRTDLALTAKGEDAARNLETRLAGISFSRVLHSPRQRARRTCELAGLGNTMEVEPDLAEWDYGDYEGRTLADIVAERPGWNLFRDGAPGGESPAQISSRVDRLIAKLRGQHGNVALFSHGHLGRVLGARWIDLPVEHAKRFLLDTTSLSILSYEHDRVDQPAISQWNSASPERGGERATDTSTPRSDVRDRPSERSVTTGRDIPDVPRGETTPTERKT